MLRGKMGYIAGIDGQVFQRTCISVDKCKLTAQQQDGGGSLVILIYTQSRRYKLLKMR